MRNRLILGFVFMFVAFLLGCSNTVKPRYQKNYIATNTSLSDNSNITLKALWYDYDSEQIYINCITHGNMESMDSLKFPSGAFLKSEKGLMITKEDGYYKERIGMLNDTIGYYCPIDFNGRAIMFLFKINPLGRVCFLDKKMYSLNSGLGAAIVLDEKSGRLFSFNHYSPLNIDTMGLGILILEWKWNGIEMTNTDTSYVYTQDYLVKNKLYIDDVNDYTLWKWIEGVLFNKYRKIHQLKPTRSVR